MAQAVLLTKGLSSSTHKGVISLFGEHFVKTEIFERSLGRALNDAQDKRLVGDYSVGFKISKEVARDLLDTAQNIVQKMKSYLEVWLETREKMLR